MTPAPETKHEKEKADKEKLEKEKQDKKKKILASLEEDDEFEEFRTQGMKVHQFIVLENILNQMLVEVVSTFK